jgi:transcriptional regulator with XRE-family HTH domain
VSTFGERLRAGMIAAGVETAGQLGAMCGISAATAGRYMTLAEADLSAKTAEKIARALNVRFGWLVTGLGPVAFRQEAVDALVLLEQLSPRDVQKWLAHGRSLVRRSM